MTFARWAFFCVSLCFTFPSIAQDNLQDLRLNQIQVKGTHNSYHQQALIAWHPSHKYTHMSLPDQLNKRGIRAFELDVHRPAIGPDLVVYHILAIDGKTTCTNFKDCLNQLKTWSDQHRDHVPITVWIEVKDATGGPKFDNFDPIDEEIRSVLADRLITPDSLQRNHESLQQAIATDGWPRLADARGKFMFILDDDARIPTVYLRNNSLQGRAMFVRASAETIQSPWAVVTKTSPGAFHSDALAKNFLISDNLCSAENTGADCHSKLMNARQAGTHVLMDDFEGDDAAHSRDGYYVALDNAFVVACHPINAPSSCSNQDLDQK